MLLNSFPGFDLHKTARVAPIILDNVAIINMGARSRIGPFNVLRDVTELGLGDDSSIGQWNWISAAVPLVEAGGDGSLSLGAHSALTSRHYLDCSGGISVGHHTTLAGVRSTLLTHGIDWREAVQVPHGISIGSYCILSSNCALAPGTEIPDGVVIGMGSTVSGKNGTGQSLWLSPRAAPVKLDIQGDYFNRSQGFIHPRIAEVSIEPHGDQTS